MPKRGEIMDELIAGSMACSPDEKARLGDTPDMLQNASVCSCISAVNSLSLVKQRRLKTRKTGL